MINVRALRRVSAHTMNFKGGEEDGEEADYKWWYWTIHKRKQRKHITHSFNPDKSGYGLGYDYTIALVIVYVICMNGLHSLFISFVVDLLKRNAAI